MAPRRSKISLCTRRNGRPAPLSCVHVPVRRCGRTAPRRRRAPARRGASWLVARDPGGSLVPGSERRDGAHWDLDAS
uniref:Uncharacterized protein n=1 Tax=Arundo donax TaxID=35708 RepID=A0A0A9HJJ5_ARUDO